MQVGITHAVGGLLALILLIGGAFTVGARWSANETNTASAAATQEEENDESATSTEEGGW